MNMEHDKADATRSKWLSQKSSSQKLAAEVVRRSQHLGESNIETVTNNLSKNNPRLAAFNTISNGFEDSWADIPDEEIPAVVDWFLAYWNALVKVLPDLGKLPLLKRQASRRESLAGWAITIHGYIRLARRLYNDKLGFELLDKLAENHVEDGTTYDYFSWDNPEWQRLGVVVPAVNKKGSRTLTARNSHQSRRAVAEALASKLGLNAA
jgi:hypothetical protein